MDLDSAKQLKGSLSSLFEHNLFREEATGTCEALSLWVSLSKAQKITFDKFLSDNFGDLRPWGKGQFGAVFETAPNQMVTIYNAHSEFQHVNRLPSRIVLGTIVEPMYFSTSDGKSFKIDVTPRVTHPEHLLDSGEITIPEVARAFYKFLDTAHELKLNIWTEDIFMYYHSMEAFLRGTDFYQDYREFSRDYLHRRPDPGQIKDIGYLNNLGFLSDLTTLVTYDAGSVRANCDSILDTSISTQQSQHILDMGLKLGEITLPDPRAPAIDWWQSLMESVRLNSGDISP